LLKQILKKIQFILQDNPDTEIFLGILTSSFEVYSIMQSVTQDIIALNDWMTMNKELEKI
jgi:hypothetical protein